jgi:hypothetical protein
MVIVHFTLTGAIHDFKREEFLSEHGIKVIRIEKQGSLSKFRHGN